MLYINITIYQVLIECDLCTLQPVSLTVVADVGHTAFIRTADVEEQSDLLQNLLGVSDAQALDKMLDSADNAAALLGVKPEQNRVSVAAATADEV